MSAENSGDEAEVYAGAGSTESIQQFLPNTIVVAAGATVTWELNEDSREIHTITWPELPPGGEFSFIEQEGGPPIIALGPVLTPDHQNGDEISQGEAFNMVITPGQPVSLKFMDPGMYPYLCMIHVGMHGSIVVVPEVMMSGMMAGMMMEGMPEATEDAGS